MCNLKTQQSFERKAQLWVERFNFEASQTNDKVPNDPAFSTHQQLIPESGKLIYSKETVSTWGQLSSNQSVEL